ncbi:MAG: PKD domain-containing protein [Bacteroidales bacterium]
MWKRKYILLIYIFITSIFIVEAQNPYDYRPHPVSTRNFDEISPLLTRDGMIYTTNQPLNTLSSETDAEGNEFFNLFYSREVDGEWEKGKLYSQELSFPLHDGMATLNFNEDLIFFTRSKDAPSSIGVTAIITGKRKVENPELGLFYATRTDSIWGEAQEFPYNEGNNISPCLGPMGDILYFASDRPGGFGGYDLYVSRFENGSWTPPKNLGPVVNSSTNDAYPFLHPSGRLYFSSAGHDNGAGGYDIFYTDFFNDRWFRPVKLGSPFNSGLNDYTYYSDADYQTGYFSTNRRGSFDIFSFEVTYPNFQVCKQQVEDNYCYIFFEENTISLDSSLYLYEWDLGDETKIRALEAEHCFAAPGDYLVQLNVVDKLTGTIAFSQAEYLVEVRKVIQPWIDSPDSVWVSQEFQLGATNSYLGDAVAGEYYWDFGDGEKDIGANVRHRFSSPGIYQVKLGIIEEAEDPETARRFCSYKTIVVEE